LGIIASILPILFKFSIDSCIAILFYSSYNCNTNGNIFWKSTNFEFVRSQPLKKRKKSRFLDFEKKRKKRKKKRT